MLRLATFNINNVNRRLPNLLAWLEQTSPDIVCLQELKAKDADFPLQAARGRRLWRGLGGPEELERRRHPRPRRARPC